MRGTTTDLIREALGSVDYPADKWSLVAEATRAGAEEETIRALRAIPQAEYANLNEVVCARFPSTTSTRTVRSESR